MRTIVAILLGAFCFALGTILLFGLVGQVIDNKGNVIMFWMLYFVFSLTGLWIIYLISHKKLNGIIEHLLVLLSIVVMSIGLSQAFTNLKFAYDTNKYLSGGQPIEQLEAENSYYSDYAQSMQRRIESIQANNLLLEAEAASLSSKLTREPIVIETIKYVQAPAAREIKEQEEDDDDDEREEEEDDD